MSLDAFMRDPWKRSHGSYEQSTFNVRPAPEFATAEVVVASLYRASGFSGQQEREVPAAGRDFAKEALGSRARIGPKSQVSQEIWRAVLYEVLESPKQPNQSSKRFLQLCPVVPDVSLYSGSARLTANSWNPGHLIQRMIRLGTGSEVEARKIWAQLFEALTISAGDDIWARWLQGEFELRRRGEHGWAQTELRDGSGPWLDSDSKLLRMPAQRFARDLSAVLDAKHCMTRKQWISLLEAVLRIGSVTHVLWLCDVNDRLWRVARQVLEGSPPLRIEDVREKVVSRGEKFLTYGRPALPVIREYASRYLHARVGLNLLLWRLDELGRAPAQLTTCADLVEVLRIVASCRKALNADQLLQEVARVKDEHARTIACKKGIGANLVEFGRHVLGQRQTTNESLRGYDQGYFLRQSYDRAPWVVSLGPVAVLSLVHCCLREAAGPRSVQRFCEHLACYGLDVAGGDIAKSELGKKLRMLGLVLDSPDAESGMLLVPPFDLTAATGAKR